MADPKYVRDFVEKLTPYAVAVGDQYGIDPVTIITQAAVETGWGREVSGNNYFGVKSHGQPGGQNIATHEEVNGKRVSTRDNFRTYPDLASSVADYGRFLSENPRYADALAKDEYKGELSGITEAGYATDGKYGSLTRGVAGMVNRNMRPLPPGSLPEVASLTDTAPPRAVTPVTPSIDMAQMRRQTAPSRLVQDSFAALPRGNPNQLGDSIGMDPIRGGKQTVPYMDAGYDPSADAMRMYVQPSASDLARGRTGRPIPALPSPQLAGQRATDRTLQAALDTRYPLAAPTPAVQSVDLRQSRLPLPDASPMTRMVASVPVPPTQSLPPLSAPARPNIPQSYAGMEGSPRPQMVAQPAGSTIDNKPQDRLQASSALPPALYGGVAPSVVPPQPMPRLARAPAALPPIDMPSVATQLAVTPPRVAPVPFSRPDFGMGGVDINENLTRNGVAAPTPMPRLNRGGIFGNPQIMGRDVPLPGIFGALQGATKAMNNSSGPFNNGLDNSIYNRMRGGDFNTPLAATGQAGGYLFAPNPNGGWINVGRAPNFNQVGNQSNGGSGGGSGGLNTIAERAFGEARNHN